MRTHWLGAAAVALAISLSACSGGGAARTVSPQASEDDLRAMLLKQLEGRGIDPAHAVSKAPEGINAPRVEQLEHAWTGDLPDGDPGYASLTWSFKLTGDYDGNGEVNITDLAPLGKQLGNHVD